MTVAEIRDLLGTSRKFAVPICEHLDAIGLTRRDGDTRVLAVAPHTEITKGD
jgi:selenocysteine-specific elongation factor